MSAKPSIARWELKEKYIELNSRLDTLVSAGTCCFCGCLAPMLNRKGEVNKNLFIEDGLHMNEKGYEIWKNALNPFFRDKLKQ